MGEDGDGLAGSRIVGMISIIIIFFSQAIVAVVCLRLVIGVSYISWCKEE